MVEDEADSKQEGRFMRLFMDKEEVGISDV